MSSFQFLKYEPTPGEKHLGIATIKAYGKLILRYKIVPNKDGGGWFPCEASYKMPSVAGQDVYAKAFMLDSTSENEELKNFIHAHVKSYMQSQGQASAQPQYAAQPQQNQNYGQQQQQYQPAQGQPPGWTPNTYLQPAQVQPQQVAQPQQPNGELPF